MVFTIRCARRALLIALTVSVGIDHPSAAKQPAIAAPPGQPSRSDDTAFPDLKPAAFDPEAEIVIPILPELPARATPLQRVRYEQARTGFLYLARLTQRIQNGTWDKENFYEQVLMTDEVYRTAAELEDAPANRIPWAEERVRKAKEFESFTERRVLNKSESPRRLNFARFHRLGTELDLLALTDEVAKTCGGSGRPLTHIKTDNLPRGIQPAHTAFPDLKARTYEQKTVTNPDGTTSVVGEETGIVPLPRLPVLPDDASVFLKVRRERILEGFMYLQHASVSLRLSLAIPDTFFLSYWSMSADTYRTAADLEMRPADRIPWYEARVRALKLGERYIELRAEIGSEPLHKLDLFRLHRFQTEADLLRLKNELETTKPTTGPAPTREKIAFKELEWPADQKMQRPLFTAFPDLKPRSIEAVEVKDAEGNATRTYRDTAVVPLPPLPVLGPHTPLADKVRLKQVREGLMYLDRTREVILRGDWIGEYFVEYVHMATEVYRGAARLENAPAKRVPWYEARVRTLKDIEQFTQLRVEIGTDPPQRLSGVRVPRLRAEAELLALKAEAVAVSVSADAPMCCLPPCGQPRSRILPRLFHHR